ncbi:hydroxymethylglutaryl-CoA lyase [Kiloniella laminariae]|uniref:Hydroxymethylglutaryl-CoA lyase n=1 Tax=Kiloniella laminariae TaxID=454162 RepID=A0ABT4LN48_9PROT|nr:hydroxymethylglutaryl-CoA lyase [Kiloniella laminariae]MCZ4282513.1 hydroxymethylglutaryl-CoA lyase [Kiloniella laminariae]
MTVTNQTNPDRVKIVEVGPRDGLQNEPYLVPTDAKIELIERLSDTGLSAVEASAFVSPKWVPQMADASEVITGIKKRPGVRYPVLTPNLKGLERAIEAGVDEIAVFGAASESFSQKNINCSIKESLERFSPVIATALKENIRVRGYVSCVLGCPYEGPIAAEKVAEVSRELHAMGCSEISLGDTIGIGTPLLTKRMIETVAKSVPIEQLAGHYHDTYGQALANIFASWELGIRVFDTSVSGLGGCPYAKGASGNVATEDVIYMFNGMGVETGVDLTKLVETAWYISGVLGKAPGSKLARVMEEQIKKSA